MTERLSLSSILVWRIPWTEEPGRLQSMGSQRVVHDWGANTFTSLSGCWHRPDLAFGFTWSLLPSAGHHIATVSSGYKAMTKHCLGIPGGTSGKESACQCRRLKRLGFYPKVGKMPWRRKWQPTPVFLPRESQGHRSRHRQTTVPGVTKSRTGLSSSCVVWTLSVAATL